MIAVICALAGMAALLFLAELLWHRKYISGEYARKFVHILGGSFVAFWPYFLTYPEIRWIAAASIVLWFVTKSMHISYAVHDISRSTIGELLYPVAVLIIAFFAQQDWVFTASILFLAFADGMAAVVGKKLGTKKMTYKVFGGKKTLQGSLAYLICAYIVLIIAVLLGGKTALMQVPLLTFGWLPIVCVVLENISPFGTDNLTVPFAVVMVLNFTVMLSLL